MAIYQYQHQNYFQDPIQNALSAASSASNIKTARANLQKNELAMEKDKAGTKLREIELDKQSDSLIDESTQGEGEGDYTISTPTPQKEINRLQALAPEVAKELKQTAEQEQQKNAMIKYFENKGASKEEATMRVAGYSKEIDSFSKSMQTKTDAEKQQVRNDISRQGKAIQTVLETSKENPQAANKMFLDYRANAEQQIKTMLRNGNTKGADIIQAELDKIPQSLIKPDGNFDTEFLMLKLSQYNTMLTTDESYQKEQETATKQENLLSLEDMKQQNKLQLERIKETKPKGTEKEFQQLMNLLDKETDPEKRKMIQSRLTKLSQPSMTSLLTNMNTVKDAQSNFAQSMGLDNPYKLATEDTRKWTQEQQAEGNQLASVIIKGLGANAKEAEKKMGEFGALSEQMQNAITGYEQVGNFRAADETVKKYFSNYFGLSEKELESSEAASAFQSMLNIKIKADSGSAVSGNEMVRNTLETASPFMSKDKILLGIKNVAKRQIGTLNSLKKVMGPIAFNLKYGSVLQNYEDIAKATDSKEVKKGDKLAELRSKDKGSREAMFNQIKTQRPNATPEQINAYLTSKGY